ncbi:MAG: ATP synthase F1 subunit gamma [Bradymonadia bacterium]
MPSLKDIRRRVSSVKNTQKITRAMKLVAAAKLRRAQNAMSELKPYAGKYEEVLTSLINQGAGQSDNVHPLLQVRDIKRLAIIALSSDRGMCGGFNTNAQRALSNFMKRYGKRESVEMEIYPVGRRMTQYVRRRGYRVGKAYENIIELVAKNQIRELSQLIQDGFESGQFDEVVLIGNRFVNAISQVPSTVTLLPFSTDALKTDEEPQDVSGDLLYEPDAETLLGFVVPQYVDVQIRQGILESIAGEHAARMNAMNNATENAGEMIASLTLQMNRARQAAITKELMEIIGGAEALK